MKNNTKNFIWNLLGTGINAFNSLFFLILITRINGVEDAGIFTLGFSTACLFFYIGIYSGRIFQVTEKDDISSLEFIVSKSITCLCMLIVSILFVLFNHYSVLKSGIILLLCIYKMLEAFSDVFYGILQKKELLYKTGISLTIKNVVNLISLFIIDRITNNVVLSILSMIIFNLLVLIFYDIKESLKYIDFKEKIRKENIIKILKNGFYPFLASFLSLYIINTPKYAIDNFWTDDVQTIFGIIVMPATVISLFAQFIVYPFLNNINKFIKNNELLNLKKLVFKILLIVGIFGILSIVIAYFLGIPVLSFIYGVELEKYKNCLMIILIGAIFTAFVYILSSILISIRTLKQQVVIYSVIAVISYFISNLFVKKSAVMGASISYFTSVFLLCILFYVLYQITLKREGKK